MPIKDVFPPLVGRHGAVLAASVRVLMATEDKTHTVSRAGRTLVDDLRKHGLRTLFETIEGSRSSIGKALGSWVNFRGIDAIGDACRHSRLNEIVRGGVTKTVIGQPPCWVMISH